MSKELALNTQLWQPKLGESPGQARERTQRDFASALIEQHGGKLEEGINPYFLILDSDGDLVDPDSGEKLENFLRRETRIDFWENKAFKRISEWARRNREGYLIWASPPSSEVGYTESRFIVMELISEPEKQKSYLEELKSIGIDIEIMGGWQKVLFCRAIRGRQTEKDCLQIARQIAPFSPEEIDTFENTDDLRATPIPFEPGFAMDWIDFLAQFIEPPEIWQAIRRGDDWRAKRKTTEIADQIVERNYPGILKATTELDFLLAGAQMEFEAARMGRPLQAVGSCGVSNIEALKRQGIFNFLYSYFSLEKTFPCPNCGMPIQRGTSRCPYCGARNKGCQLHK